MSEKALALAGYAFDIVHRGAFLLALLAHETFHYGLEFYVSRFPFGLHVGNPVLKFVVGHCRLALVTSCSTSRGTSGISPRPLHRPHRPAISPSIPLPLQSGHTRFSLHRFVPGHDSRHWKHVVSA